MEAETESTTSLYFFADLIPRNKKATILEIVAFILYRYETINIALSHLENLYPSHLKHTVVQHL